MLRSPRGCVGDEQEAPEIAAYTFTLCCTRYAQESERKEKSDKKEAEAKEKKAEAKKKADEKKKAAAAKKAEAKRKAVEAIKAEVTAIYKAHNPNKLSDIDSILTRYKGNFDSGAMCTVQLTVHCTIVGREKKLLKDLKEKYKNKPPRASARRAPDINAPG
eukprot:COSAG01_NODE_1626_length_9689_cov_12.495412_11_plen_161_part_00